MTEIDRRVEGNLLYELSEEGGVYSVRMDGRPLFSTGPRGEQGLAELAIGLWEGREDVTVLLGGLGAGHTLRALLKWPEVSRVDVLEISSSVIEWHRKHLAPVSGHAIEDPRVVVHQAELGEFLRANVESKWFVIVIDIDEWPESLSRPENVEHYHDEGLELFARSLRGDGVLVMWTTHRDNELEVRMTKRFGHVARVAVPIDVGETTRLDFVYRARRK